MASYGPTVNATRYDEMRTGVSRKRVRVRLSPSGFCDSTGMGMFIDLSRDARAHHGWIRLAALTPSVLKSFQTLNLDQVLDIRAAVSHHEPV